MLKLWFSVKWGGKVALVVCLSPLLWLCHFKLNFLTSAGNRYLAAPILSQQILYLFAVLIGWLQNLICYVSNVLFICKDLPKTIVATIKVEKDSRQPPSVSWILLQRLTGCDPKQSYSKFRAHVKGKWCLSSVIFGDI